MKYIINTRVAISDGVSKKDIIAEAEKFFDARYHQSYSSWEAHDYPYLTMGESGNITGTRHNGFKDYVDGGRVAIDWYQLSPETKQLLGPVEQTEPGRLTKVFNETQEFKKELL